MSRNSRIRRGRAHCVGPDLYLGRAPLPVVTAWIEQNRDRFPLGKPSEIEVFHDADCRYPQGFPCTCLFGPEIRIKGENPEAN